MQKEIRPFYAVTDDRYAWPPAKLAGKNSYSNMHATSYKKERTLLCVLKWYPLKRQSVLPPIATPTHHLGTSHFSSNN
jgi:hypothetical protein